MEVKVFPGQWISAMSAQLEAASDGDCFLLPSHIHLHAFEIARQSMTVPKSVTVEVILCQE